MEFKNRKKYGEVCASQMIHFSPFIVSSDGIFAHEATQLLKQSSGIISKKWHEAYYHVCGFVRSRMSIALERETKRFISGSMIPSFLMSHQKPFWEDGSGLGCNWY